jgi:hypothetical protein
VGDLLLTLEGDSMMEADLTEGMRLHIDAPGRRNQSRRYLRHVRTMVGGALKRVHLAIVSEVQGEVIDTVHVHPIQDGRSVSV